MSMRRVGRADIASEGLFAGCHVPLRVAAAKRGFDVVVAAVGLAATAPVWLLGRRLVGELRVGRVWRDGEYGRALGGLGSWLRRDAAALGQAARRAWSRSA